MLIFFKKDLLITSQAFKLREQLDIVFWMSARHLTTSFMTSFRDEIEKIKDWMKLRWEGYQSGKQRIKGIQVNEMDPPLEALMGAKRFYHHLSL